MEKGDDITWANYGPNVQPVTTSNESVDGRRRGVLTRCPMNVSTDDRTVPYMSESASSEHVGADQQTLLILDFELELQYVHLDAAVGGTITC